MHQLPHLDFDDTHLKTIITRRSGGFGTPGVAEHQPVSGEDFLNALILGAEVECRIGNAVYPRTTTLAGTSRVPSARSGRRRRGQTGVEASSRASRWSGQLGSAATSCAFGF